MGQEYPGTEQEAMLLLPLADHMCQASKLEYVKRPRRGKIRHVTKNQRFEITSRRSRDMGPL